MKALIRLHCFRAEAYENHPNIRFATLLDLLQLFDLSVQAYPAAMAGDHKSAAAE